MLTSLNVLLGNSLHLKQSLFKAALNIKEEIQLNQIRPQPKKILYPLNCQQQSILLIPHHPKLEKLSKLLNNIFKLSHIDEYRLDTIIFCLNNEEEIETIQSYFYDIQEIYFLIDSESQSSIQQQISNAKKDRNIFYVNQIDAFEQFFSIVQRQNRSLIHLRNYSFKQKIKNLTQRMVQRYTQQIGFTKFINQIDHMKFLLTPNQNQIQIFDSDSDLPKNIFNLELEMIIELAGKQKEHFSPYPHNYYSESELFNQNDRFYIYKLPSILKLNLDNLKFFVMQSQCQICHTALFQISQGFILFQFYYKVFYLNVIDNMMNEIFYQQSKLIDKFKVEDESQNIFLKESNHHLDLNILNKSNYELKVEDNSKSQNLFQNQYPIIEKQTELSFHQVKNLNQPSKSIKYKIVNNTKVNQQEFNQNSFIQVMFLSNEGDEKSQIFNQITQQNQSKYKKKQIEQFTQSSVISEKFIFHDCPIMEFELYEEDKIIPFRDYFSKQSIHFFFIFIQYQRTDTMNKRVLDMIKKLYPLDRQRMAIIVTNWSGDNKQKNEIQLKFNHYQFKQIIFLIQKAQKDEILKEVEYCLLNVQASQQNFQNTVFEVTNNNYIEELANKFCQNSQLPRLRNRENLDRSFYDIENESKKQEDELLDKEILQMKYLQSKKLTLKKGRKNNLGTIKNQQIVQKRIKKQTTRKYKRK